MDLKSLFFILTKKSHITLPILLSVVFFFSVRLTIYNFLKNYLPIMDAYLLDQGLFFLIFLVFSLFWVLVKWKTIFTYTNLLALVLFSLVFAGYFIFLLNYQSEILNRYFVKDDQFVLLPALLREEALDYRYSNKLDYYYYHFGAAVLLFKFFHLDVYYYNVFTLATLALSGAIFLKLLNRLSLIHGFESNWTKIFAVITTLLYMVSPSIMENFVYIEHSAAIGYVAAGTLLSIYFYLRFLENRTKTIYFLLSFILMIFLLKTAMVRTGFLPAFLILLEILSIKAIVMKQTIIRILLILLPFYSIAKPYLSPAGSSSRLYGIGIERFIDLDRMYLFFANLIPLFMPFQFMSPFFRSIRARILGDFSTPSEGFVLNHMLFTGGLIFFIFTSVVILILFLKKKNIKYILYFWSASLGSLLFYMLFGNVIEKQLPPPHFFDLSLLSYGTVPGSRYYSIPLIFILTTFYLIFISTLSRMGQKAKHLMFGVTCLILALIVYSNINFTQAVNHSANEGIVTVKVITEKVLAMVPDNEEKKVIYSTSGRIGSIEFIIRGFHGFFKYQAPDYFWQKEELLQHLKENQIEERNFFAFSFDGNSLVVEDKSIDARKQFQNYLFDNTKTP